MFLPKSLKIALTAAALSISTIATAAPVCTKLPASKWLTPTLNAAPRPSDTQ